MRIKIVPVSLAFGLLFIGPLAGQDHDVSGSVTSSATGEPLIGVNITVQNTNLGTITDGAGRYELFDISPQAVIVFDYIGFTAQQVTVGDQRVIDVALVPEALIGEDIVVIGYGSQSRRDVSSAISSLKSEDFTQGANASLQSLLQARAAGVIVTANDGNIGSEMKIRIRGGSSINASNNPMIVIDGVPISNSSANPGGFGTGGGNTRNGTQDNPLGMINPDDIASIDILKDAASSAIYGARGGNGVILITTKEGRPGDISLTYSGSTSSSTIIKKLDLMSASQYLSYANSIVSLIGKDTSGVDIYGGPKDGGADTDWQDAVLQTGISQSHNISFGAGTQATQYRASIGYLDQEGILLNSKYNRISARLNVRHSMLDGKLKLGLKLSPSLVTRDNTPYFQRAGFEGLVFTNVMKMNPTYPVYNADGTYYEYPTTGIRNPVAILNEISLIGENLRILSSVYAEYELIQGLRIRTTVALDAESYSLNGYEPNTLPYSAAVGGRATVENNQRRNLYFTSTLNYHADMGNSNIDALAGYEFQEFTNSGFGATTKNYVTDSWLSNNLGGGADFTSAPYSYKNVNRLVSFFGRVAYNMGGRINVMGTIRQEGSSRFGEKNKWGLFPSASVGFFVTDDTKIRASWGVTGNQEIGNYRSLVTLGSGANAVIGGTLLSGVSANQLANPELKWETTSDMNLGVDFSLLDNKITGTIDLYSKTTTDMLVEVNVPQPAVVTTKLDNVGSVENKGIEILLNAPIMSTGDLSWNASFNFTSNRNKVISLGKDVDFIITGAIGGAGLSNVFTSIIIPDEPFASFYGFRFLGYDADGQETLSAEREILGSPFPDYTFGITNTINYRNIDFSFYIWSVQGNEILNNTRLEYQRPSNPTNDINLFIETSDDVDNGMDPSAAVAYTDRFIEDGSFIRLQNVTLGYRLNTARFKNLRLYVSADNLITLTDYSGYDPEVSTIMGLSEGVDYTSYPKAKTISFGINLGL